MTHITRLWCKGGSRSRRGGGRAITFLSLLFYFFRYGGGGGCAGALFLAEFNFLFKCKMPGSVGAAE